MRLILTGILFLIGGLSGAFVLRGTGSSGALALVGLVMIVMGAVSASNGGDGFEATPTDADRERDAEQWAEYQRVRAEQAAKARQAEAAKVRANDPRAQRLEALMLMTPGAREQIADLLARTKQHLNEDEQLDVALDTARRLHQARQAQA